MLPGCLVYVCCETKSNPGSELLGPAPDNGPLHLSLVVLEVARQGCMLPAIS